MKRSSGQSWLEQQLRKLVVLDEEIKKSLNVKDGVVNEFMDLTPLKLAFYNYVIDIYTRIIPKFSDFFKNVYYVDLFSGSGINMIENDMTFIGSPLIASRPKFNKFKTMFFIDLKEKYCNALEQRLNALGVTNKQIMCEDCNLRIDHILDTLKSGSSHSLIIIDPYALEIKWNTLEKLLNINSDIILTFQSRLVARAVGKALKKEESGEPLNEFFGDDSWRTITDQLKLEIEYEEPLMKLYVDKIRRTRVDPIIALIRIKGNGFSYYLIFITRKTSGGSPWMKGIMQGKVEIEKEDSKAVSMVSDIISGKQRRLL